MRVRVLSGFYNIKLDCALNKGAELEILPEIGIELAEAGLVEILNEGSEFAMKAEDRQKAIKKSKIQKRSVLEL